MILDRPDFQRILFRTAFCVMACDGHIDEREVNEIKLMNKSTAYFNGIDLTDELEELLSDLKERGKQFVDELIESLFKFDLSIVQELLLLEVALRIVYSDERVDENEIKFLRFLRSKLKIYDEIIRDRFGAVVCFFDKDYSQEIVKEEVYHDLFETILLPELKELATINFTKDKNKHS